MGGFALLFEIISRLLFYSLVAYHLIALDELSMNLQLTESLNLEINGERWLKKIREAKLRIIFYRFMMFCTSCQKVTNFDLDIVYLCAKRLSKH